MQSNRRSATFGAANLLQAPLSRALPVVAILLTLPPQASGAELPRFRRHEVDRDSIFCACAVIDVNRDGRLDIVCGGWWYEAPTWQRRFLREVEMIRGRYDDYSNLPVDVNGDGWTDLVSANYRSQSLYWVEHPGTLNQPWTRHVIDVPGPMETGRLADVNQDGQLDILPNGVKFAAWWEFVLPKDANPGQRPTWLRHDLPPEVVGHGVGCGDVDGDGRADIVGPRGWAKAPVNRRGDRWIWHPEFHLNRDCSIPILVHDVDADGDSDIVWGRGHDIGLYWLEQSRDAAGQRQWSRHAIDTSWSQPHSILLADVDNDGQAELVAGKRYMGHDGKDPGEYDPLAIYWYDFDAAREVWRRGVISEGGQAGVGLDPKVADLDGDGDVDLVTSGRSGLFWFENLLVGAAPAERSPAPAPLPCPIDDHANLLVYPELGAGETELRPVQSAAQWALRRACILDAMQRVMGPLPDSSRRVPVAVVVEAEVDTPKYVRRQITYAAEPGDRVPAYVLVPKDLTSKSPAMLCLHQTTPIGKDEPAGLGGNSQLHYAHELANRGYVCIVPDYPSFGDYDDEFSASNHGYVSVSMKAVWNNIRALDVLETLPQVDVDRLGCIGHSLGGHNGLFTAVFDQRLRAVVTSCGFTAFHHYRDGDLSGWSSARYMPRIRTVYQNDPDRMPFDFHEVVAAIAPRPLFVNAPLHDDNFDVQGVRDVMREVEGLYEVLQAPHRPEVVSPDASHDFPPAVREAAYVWLDRQLRGR